MTRPPCHDCDENRDHCGQCGCCGHPSKLPPAQPTVGRCSDQCPTLFGITGPFCALPYGHLGSHESEHGTTWSFMPGVDDKPSAQPDVASGPDVDAGGAGDEWPTPDTGHTQPDYLGAGRAYWSPSPDADTFAGQEGWIRAIDIACAPVVRDRDSLARRCAVRFQEAEQLRAELAEAIRERDEAWAKTDGGEWTWFYGFTNANTGQFIHHGDENQARALAKVVKKPIQRQRVWLGPVEPVTDDGSGHA